jgi:predicted  nucleic acid-binding Zn-ribbon protein
MEEEGYEGQIYQQGQFSGNINSQIKDLEEKQRIIKNRLLLIGQNLVEIKERTDERIIGIKKDMEIIKQNMERLISFLETASREMPKFARKEDVEILAKQARMFQPLNPEKKN